MLTARSGSRTGWKESGDVSNAPVLQLKTKQGDASRNNDAADSFQRGQLMLHLCNSGTRLCDGLNRREFLRAGGLGLAGLTLPMLLSGQARAGGSKPRAKSVIQLFMW